MRAGRGKMGKKARQKTHVWAPNEQKIGHVLVQICEVCRVSASAGARGEAVEEGPCLHLRGGVTQGAQV